MTKILKLVCLAVVLALALSSAAVLVAQAGPSPDSTTPPDGYEPQPTEEKHGATDALLIQDFDPWDYNSNELALQELGISYDVINSTNLGTVDLSQYKFIMYASDQPTSYYTNLANNIAAIEAFVSGGGLLIGHVCDDGWAGGDWTTEHILPGNVQHVGVGEDDLVIVDITHPIVRGTPPGNFDIYGTDPNYFDGWVSSTHGYLTNLPPNADVVIEIESGANAGQPTYIDYPFGSGKVLATMQTVEWGYGAYGMPHPWPELLRNELRYGAAGVLPPVAVGGEVYPVDKLTILAPWIGLAMLLIGSITWFTLRRRMAHS